MTRTPMEQALRMALAELLREAEFFGATAQGVKLGAEKALRDDASPERRLRLMLFHLLEVATIDTTWPPVVVAKRNAEDLLRERITPQAYLQAVTAREVA